MLCRLLLRLSISGEPSLGIRFSNLQHEERFLSPRPGAQKTGARRSRVARLQRAGSVWNDSVWRGFMSELKPPPPRQQEKNRSLGCARDDKVLRFSRH